MHKVIIILLSIALGLLFAVYDRNAPPKGFTVAVKPAPIFEFTDIKGRNFKLDQFKGKTIILNFWATWCAPCVAEFPQLLELAHREKDNIVFIALSVDENPNAIERFIKRLPIEAQKNITLKNVIIGLDTDKTISRNLFKTIMYPETFIIDKDLMIIQKIEGITDWIGDDIKNKL